MIRPITIATFLMACGSGLYLYQEKHEVQLLDRTIEKTVRETGAFRDQSRVLAAEWTMLNDPERLRQYADTYLPLKAILPTQFTNMANLDSRLPAVELPQPKEADPVVASAGDAAMQADDPTEAVTIRDLPPPPPLPPSAAKLAAASTAAAPTVQAATAAPAVQTAGAAPAKPAMVQRAAASVVATPAEPAPAVAQVAAKPVERKVAAVDARRPSDQRAVEAHPLDQRVADQHPIDLRPSEQRPSEQRVADTRPDSRNEQRPPLQRMAESRPAEPVNRVAEARPLQAQVHSAPQPVRVAAERPMPYVAPRAPVPVAAVPTPVSAPYGGSLLGMARSAPPAPRPMPVNATNWYNAN